MTTIDPQAAHSARRISDPLARAAITAELQRMARYAAGLLAGLTDAAKDNDVRVDPSLTGTLCLLDELLIEATDRIGSGDVYANRMRVAA